MHFISPLHFFLEFIVYLFKVYYNCLEVFSYWVGQKVYLGFLVTSYGKIQTNFQANPILCSSGLERMSQIPLMDPGTTRRLGKQSSRRAGMWVKQSLFLRFFQELLLQALRQKETEAAASEPRYQLPGCDQAHQLLGFQLLQTSSPGAILGNFAFDQGACGVKPCVFHFSFRSQAGAVSSSEFKNLLLYLSPTNAKITSYQGRKIM